MTMIMVVGSDGDAVRRMERAGWRRVGVSVGPRAYLHGAEKGGAFVVFDPGGTVASEPCAQTPMGFVPLGRGHPLFGEAVDLVSDAGAGGSMDFTDAKRKFGQ